jgi:hypothetical protein
MKMYGRQRITVIMRILLQIAVILILASGFVTFYGCETKLTTKPTTDNDILVAFSTIARNQMIPERNEIFRWWILQTILGKVEYIKEKDIYIIQFPTLDDKGVEIWGMDKKNSVIYPVNDTALLSAVVLFCYDKDDKTGDCQWYFRDVEALKQRLGK